ncbi:MAG TPA: SpoIIE family protein phosphatase [Bacteroidota bacterium]
MEQNRAERLLEWGAASFTLPGQTECGDLSTVREFPGGAIAAVADGLGHGNEAATAARVAVRTIEAHAEESVISILRIAHEALRSTRGVVLSMASFNGKENTMSWLGVGNVEGVLLRHDPKSVPNQEVVLLRGGVVGYQLPEPYASVVQVSAGDTLILTTDGIRSDFGEYRKIQRESPQRIAERVCSERTKGNDDGLVLVVRYLGTHHE